MAISAGVGSATAGGTTNAQAVTLNGCTAGRALAIRIIFESATATISSVTISGESNATLAASLLSTGDAFNSKLQCAYLANITASGNKTVTVNLSASVVVCVLVEEIQGQDTSGGFYVGEISQTANETTTGIFNVTGTTSNANDGIFGMMVVEGSQELMVVVTMLAMQDTNRTTYGWSVYDAGAAGAQSYTVTTNAFGIWGAKAMIVKAASGGGGEVRVPMRYPEKVFYPV